MNKEELFWQLVEMNPSISFMRSWEDDSIRVSAPIEQMKLPSGFYNIGGKISNRKDGVAGGVEFPIVVENKLDKEIEEKGEKDSFKVSKLPSTFENNSYLIEKIEQPSEKNMFKVKEALLIAIKKIKDKVLESAGVMHDKHR